MLCAGRHLSAALWTTRSNERDSWCTSVHRERSIWELACWFPEKSIVLLQLASRYGQKLVYKACVCGERLAALSELRPTEVCACLLEM
jgi:hypothetical protein